MAELQRSQFAEDKVHEKSLSGSRQTNWQLTEVERHDIDR